MMFSKLALAATLMATAALAQDPAQGWMAYARAECPSGTRLTKMTANWNVGANPPASQAFFSPWFGIDPADNLNLLQPVNPWLGDQWVIYTENFNWSPQSNYNSPQQPTSAGHTLEGEIKFNGESAQTYLIKQTDTTTGVSSQQTRPVQQLPNGEFKNFTILYAVMEKVWPCQYYPPDNKVTFSNIYVECNGEQYTPTWTTHHVDQNCDMEAHVVSPSEVSITWDTNSAKQPSKEAVARSMRDRDAFFKRMGIPQRPPQLVGQKKDV